MVVVLVVNKLKHLILFFVSIFRRALCCFRRRRRVSVDAVPLTHVGVVANHGDPEDWTWEDKPGYSEPKTVQVHIELYRKRKSEKTELQQQQEEVPMDFFENMAPKITRQTKVYISEEHGESKGANRLNVVETVPVVGSGCVLMGC